MTPEGTIDKIQAILRKASEANSSEAEREVAMHMANKLLLKHGLAMEDVVGAGKDDEWDENKGDWEHERFFSTEGDFDSWKSLLLHRLSRVYFCQMYRIGRGPRGAYSCVLVGRKRNAATCRAMFEFVAPQLEVEFNIAVSRMSQQHRFARRYALSLMTEIGAEQHTDDEMAEIARDHFEEILLTDGRDAAVEDIKRRCGIDSTHYAKKVRSCINRMEIAPADTDNLGVWRRTFFESAVTRVGSRLREMMREDVEDLGEPGKALVKDEAADLKRFLESLNLGLRTGQSNRGYDAAGAEAGTKAGNRADLTGHRKVSKAGPKQLNR